MGILDELHGGGEPKPFNDDMVRRNGIPEAAFRLLHDICYHHDGRDVYDYVKRAQEILSTVPATGAKPPQGGTQTVQRMLIELELAGCSCDLSNGYICGIHELARNLKQALAATPNQGSADGWVSTIERNPESADYVLCGWDSGPFKAMVNRGKYLGDGKWSIFTPTHWMPLPAPPVTDAVKQEKEG